MGSTELAANLFRARKLKKSFVAMTSRTSSTQIKFT
jgi:hypothetical protein